MWREALSRLRFLFSGRSRAEVDEELQFHIDRQIEANLEAGMSEEEARREGIGAAASPVEGWAGAIGEPPASGTVSGDSETGHRGR